MSTFKVRDPGEIGVAFLGVGRMGQTHIRTLAGIPNVRVIVVADPNLEAAERGRAIARAERAVASADEALLDPRVEAVVIATPTSTHASLIEMAVRAGKAVWSEKPIALDITETERVVELVKTTGIPVQLGFMRRFDPGYVMAKERIESGALGRLETFRALSRDTYPRGSSSSGPVGASSSTWPSTTSTSPASSSVRSTKCRPGVPCLSTSGSPRPTTSTPP